MTKWEIEKAHREAAKKAYAEFSRLADKEGGKDLHARVAKNLGLTKEEAQALIHRGWLIHKRMKRRKVLARRKLLRNRKREGESE